MTGGFQVRPDVVDRWFAGEDGWHGLDHDSDRGAQLVSGQSTVGSSAVGYALQASLAGDEPAGLSTSRGAR